jgi:hypothetical protein
LLGPTKWLGNRNAPPPAGRHPCGICGITTDLLNGNMLVPVGDCLPPPCEFHSLPRIGVALV